MAVTIYHNIIPETDNLDESDCVLGEYKTGLYNWISSYRLQSSELSCCLGHNKTNVLWVGICLRLLAKKDDSILESYDELLTRIE